MDTPDGFEVPVHRSLTQPLTFAGLPRALGLCLWTITTAFTLGLHQLWVLPVALGLHVLLAAITRREPYFIPIFFRSLRSRRRLPP